MKAFEFEGPIPASKSHLNRCLLLQAHSPSLRIEGDSSCEDVLHMKGAIASIARGEAADCGDAALVFRLVALFASRRKGQHILRGSSRLLSRPHEGLLKNLAELGVKGRIHPDRLEITSDGWKDPGKALKSSSEISSQFASALILNAWNLSFPLEIETGPVRVSEGYLELSLSLARQAGMRFSQSGSVLKIPAEQRLGCSNLQAEADVSSAFAVAALAAAAGHAHITNFPVGSMQPDQVFVEILARMGVPIRLEGSHLSVDQAITLKPIQCDLGGSPDLFPVLAILCAFAEGKSRLFGARHLVHKESDRIAATARLLQALGRKCLSSSDGIEIQGRTEIGSIQPFQFDPDWDHRMVMAATVAQWKGVRLQIRDPGHVRKSFPEFLLWVR